MATIGKLHVQFSSNVATLVNDMTKASRSVNAASTSINKSLGVMQAAFRGLAAGLSVNFITSISDEMTDIKNKINVVTDSTKQMNAVFAGVVNVSKTTQSSLSSTATLYQRLAVATKDLGLSQDDVLKMTQAVNQTFRISGATTMEAASSAVQLAQGLASGALKGDELRSVLENNTRLSTLLADALGVSRGQLRDMGADGLITAEVVAGALLGSFEQLNAEAAKIAPTFSRAMTVAKDQFKVGFSQEVQAGFGQISDSIVASTDGARRMGEIIGYVVSEFASLTTEIGGAVNSIFTLIGGFRTFEAIVTTVITGIKITIKSLAMVLLGLNKSIVDTVVLAEKSVRKVASLVPGLKGKVGEDSVFAGVQANIDRAGKSLAESIVSDMNKQNGIISGKTAIGDMTGFKVQSPVVNSINEAAEGMKKLKNNTKDAKSAMDNFTSNASSQLSRMVTGVDGVRDGLRGLLGIAQNALADQFITPMINKGLGALFGGFRANGGDVQKGKAYVVGEKRPELFVPSSNGTIIPSVPQGGSSGGTYYIDARGADAAGLARLENQIRALNGSIEHRAVNAVRSENRRNPNYIG